ncbi:LamB/YcsF family protein [Saccharopolyspora hattusasensis]|uniref:LamB/YcsF family protein n=1 Tax=Saccharopolyspora hattusasensis TaxID=1128679 RepID=UPI003D96F03D
MKKLIDLNADAGESFGRWRLGDDARLMPLVSSVNVACGWHAGDPATMRRSAGLAKSHGTALGAHPGFPDLVGFGRRALAMTPQQAADACLYQLGALRSFADSLGIALTHVKPHGAFYGLTIREPEVTDAIAEVLTAVDPELILVLLAGPTAEKVAARGVRVAREAFADLDYDDDGHIIIEPDPVAKSPEHCAEKAMAILAGEVVSTSGKTLPVDADTICLHGDRPNAIEIAQAVRQRFSAADVTVAPMAEVIANRP